MNVVRGVVYALTMGTVVKVVRCSSLKIWNEYQQTTAEGGLNRTSLLDKSSKIRALYRKVQWTAAPVSKSTVAPKRSPRLQHDRAVDEFTMSGSHISRLGPRRG
jgi:hypothetical protein